MTVRVTASGPSLGLRLSEFSDRRFKYLVIAPAILIILLIGLFPLIYTLMVSVQNISMTEEDTSFHGIVQYLALFRDSRLWLALLHTLIIAAVALPAELILGMLMALLFLERLPGRQIFVALLVLPIMIAPVVAGATWRLLFDNRYGPINQILGWFAGEPVTILWTINTHFVYPAILHRGNLAVDAVHVPAAARGVHEYRPEPHRVRADRWRLLLDDLPAHHAAGDLAGGGDRGADPRA